MQLVIFRNSYKSFLFYLKFDLLLVSNLNQNWHLSYIILLFCELRHCLEGTRRDMEFCDRPGASTP